MSPVASPQTFLSPRQVSAAAENLTAAQFSLYGFDVLEQAGRARFPYDLGVARSGGMLKISVHGSLDGFWDLVESFVERGPRSKPTKADYHRAIDLWLERHGSRVTCCLVKFASAELDEMPRIYLASAAEIAERLHETTEHLGQTALCEEYEIVDSYGSRRLEALPERWRFSRMRVAELMRSPEGARPLQFRFSAAAKCSECAGTKPAACVECLPMMN